MSQPPETWLEKKRKDWIKRNPDNWPIVYETEMEVWRLNERTKMLFGVQKKAIKR